MGNGKIIYVSGHKGLVGSALARMLENAGYTNILTRSFAELDLRVQSRVDDFFQEEQPEYVILAAARVGGIAENQKYPADFMLDNILIETNVIRAAFKNSVKKLIFICSSSVYPSGIICPSEDDIFNGPLEKSNEGYSAAKLFGLKLCEMYHRQYGVNYFSVIPCNLYGPNDRFMGNSAHVVPSLIRKFHQAKIQKEPQVSIWGTGKAVRELLYADDMADICVALMEKDDWPGPCVNIGSQNYFTISELAQLVKQVVGYEGEIVFDRSYPEGQLLRKMDLTKLSSLYHFEVTPIKEGLAKTYQFYLDNFDNLR